LTQTKPVVGAGSLAPVDRRCAAFIFQFTGEGRNQQAPDWASCEGFKSSPQAANRKTDFCRKVGVSVSDDSGPFLSAFDLVARAYSAKWGCQMWLGLSEQFGAFR
jgi:hypothetical protein